MQPGGLGEISSINGVFMEDPFEATIVNCKSLVFDPSNAHRVIISNKNRYNHRCCQLTCKNNFVLNVGLVYYNSNVMTDNKKDFGDLYIFW